MKKTREKTKIKNVGKIIKYRNADSVSISLATLRHATHRAAVMEISF